MKTPDAATYASAISTATTNLSKVLGVDQRTAANILIRAATNRVAKRQSGKMSGFCCAGCEKQSSLGDFDVSSLFPGLSTEGLFAAPAIALYSFGAVLLGIGLFLATRKKK